VFATESAPGLAITGITGGYLLKLIVALGSVLIIFLLLAFLTKKFHRYGQSHNRNLSVLSTMSVGTRERLMLVQVGEAQLLLGVTPSRIDKLFVLDKPLPGSDQSATDASSVDTTVDSASTDFRQKLNQFIGNKGSAV
jgi:flagellar protein FliO/FliZ